MTLCNIIIIEKNNSPKVKTALLDSYILMYINNKKAKMAMFIRLIAAFNCIRGSIVWLMVIVKAYLLLSKSTPNQ
jgi:hypothetical protein